MTETTLPPRAELPDLTANLPRIWHGVHFVCAPRARPPFAVAALVVEDDTWQVLGANPDFRPTAEHPIRLWRSLAAAEPLEPGDVVEHEGFPIRLHAIVHDLDREPICREEWIAEALDQIFGIVAERRFETLALPLLGTRHGRLPERSSLRLLDESLSGLALRPLRRLWLITAGD